MYYKFNIKLYKAENISSHGGSIRVFLTKNNYIKEDNSVKKILAEEEKYGIKKFITYQKFGEKIYQIRENVIKNLKNLKEKEKVIIGYGAPAKATTALNFFKISKEINYIIDDNKLKNNKFIPGVNIPIYSKNKFKDKNSTILVLAWNFFEEIKNKNKNLSSKILNIKDLEKII